MPPQNQSKEQDTIQLRKEIRDRLTGFIVASLGLVAGLAWNDAVRATIDYLFPLPNDSLSAKFMYAIIISLIAVIITVYIMRLLQPPAPPTANQQK